MKNIIIGTAGHIDHGKTALIKSLTGKDTDSLPEEKKRGITIDIGFAYLNLDKDNKIGIIDVPGHEKFIKNMVTGIYSINYIMIVIAADDGIMPQTEEHFNIIKLFKIKNGIIVLTKTDLVSEDIIEKRKFEIKNFFKNSFLENSEIIETSIKDNLSILNLKNILIKDIKNLKNNLNENKNDNLNEKFRMYIDRCFSIKGFGTVVTGTLMKGKIDINDNFFLYPKNLKGKIKSIENHNKKLEYIEEGNRCALNLTQVEKNLIKRGDIISSNKDFLSSNIIDIMFLPLKNKKIKNNQRIRLHIGTREVIGRIKFFKNKLLINNEIFIDDNSEIKKIFGQLFLEDKISSFHSELGIIRNFSPMDTIGGAKILNVFGKKTKKDDEIYIQKLFDLDTFGEIQKKKDYSEILKQILKDFHQKNYLKKGILRLDLKNQFFNHLSFKEFKNIVDNNIAKNIIKVEKFEEKEYISLNNFKIKLIKKDKILKENIFKIYKESGVIPQKKEIIETKFKNKIEFNKLHDYLFEENMIIYLSEDFYILKGFFKEIQKIIINFLEKNEKLKISDLKNLLNINRKTTIIILNKLDNLSFTKRINDYRILNKEKKND